MLKSMDAFSDTIEVTSKLSYEKVLKECKILDEVSDGARFKYWVMYNDSKFLLKLNKINTYGNYTYENVAEMLTKYICDSIGVPCVDIVLFDSGILSKVDNRFSNPRSFIEYSDEFSHSFHMSNLSTFNISTLLNKNTNKYYKETVVMLLVDILIGNSDRHPGNFMYSSEGFYPLFDNGSSLCAYINEEQIQDILIDSLRFNSILITKSKPVLRDNGTLTHYRLLTILKNNFKSIVEEFTANLNKLDITSELNKLGSYISNDRKKLLEKFILTRISWFKES